MLGLLNFTFMLERKELKDEEGDEYWACRGSESWAG